MTKEQLLSEMCLLYWLYDTKPDFTDTEEKPLLDNSTEKLVLDVYESLKKDVLARYPWRSAIRYVDVKAEIAETPNDPRFKYTAKVPENFVKENGFWYDSNRTNLAKNQMEVVGKEIRSNLESFTMGYVANVSEEELDPWVIRYLEAYIAYKAADIGGLSTDRINALSVISENEFWVQSNIDYKMTQNKGEEIQDSLNQFVIS